MHQSFSGRFRRELGFLRRQFLQDGTRPFADVLSAELVGRTLAALGTTWYDRIYSAGVRGTGLRHLASQPLAMSGRGTESGSRVAPGPAPGSRVLNTVYSASAGHGVRPAAARPSSRPREAGLRSVRSR